MFLSQSKRDCSQMVIRFGKQIQFYHRSIIINRMSVSQKIQPLRLKQLLEDESQKKTLALPLQFQFLPVELLSKQFTKLNNNNPYRIHYLGPRPINTLSIHKKYAFNERKPLEIGNQLQGRQPLEKYKIDSRKIIESGFVLEKLRANIFYKQALFYRAFEGMNPSLNLQKEYVFNSAFESGNLDCVIKLQERQFDLFLRIDSNTKGHVQWFYFSIKNGSKKEKIKLNVCNLSKAKSLYESGMQPYIFSREQHKLTNKDWTQGGVNLGLQKKELRYQYLQEKLNKYSYYCLEFEYMFEHQNDEVFFAYCVPYTFSKLINVISLLPKSYTEVAVLGKSLSGIDIPILHITDFQSLKQKKNVLITGRMHPGQSNSSYMLQGFLNFITSAQKEATELRKKLNFFIVPMVNPDGVVVGNTRTSAAGKDLNRQFLLANRDLYPQVALVKQFARKLHNLHGIFMYLDFHGHSRKKNTFFYGPAYAISEPNYYKSRILPKIIEKINSNFRFHSCSFVIDEQKKQTARAVLFQHLKINFTFTIQTSIGYFYDCQNFKTVQFNSQQWRKMGFSISEGIGKFIIGYEQYEDLLKERRASRQKKRPPTAPKYSVTEGKIDYQDEGILYKRMQPLKIVYNDKSLFGSVIQELKVPKINSYIKQIDDDCDSDAHDDNQDFDRSKMKEFNNLLTDVAKKQQSPLKKKETKSSISGPRSSREKKIVSTVDNFQDLEEQLKFFSQIEVKKPLTGQMQREKKLQSKTLKIKNDLIKRQALHNDQDFKKHFMNKTAYLTKNNTQKSEKQVKLQAKADKKIESECQFPSKDKASFFGQYHLFVENEEKKIENKLNYQRNSVFRRQKSRKSRRSNMDQSRFQSETFLQKANNNRQNYQNNNQLKFMPKISPPKPNNYEFKFDQIQAVIIAKEKFKEFYKNKINKSSRNSVIGPASFYGIRQNINLKLNKKKYCSQDRGEPAFNERQSMKIVKFT